jgi:hypothetical protein
MFNLQVSDNFLKIFENLCLPDIQIINLYIKAYINSYININYVNL